MKKVLKLFSLVLVMIVVLTGCKTKGTKEEINEAIDKTEKAKFYDATYMLDYKLDDIDYYYHVSSETNKGNDIVVNKLEIEEKKLMGVAQQLSGYNAYEELKNGVTTRYAYKNNTWEKTEVETINFFPALKELVSNSKIVEVDSEREDGIKYKVFLMSTTPETFAKFVNDSNLLGENEVIGSNVKEYILTLNIEDGTLSVVEFIQEGDMIKINNNKGEFEYNDIKLAIGFMNVKDISIESNLSIPQEVKDSVVQSNTPVTDTTNNTPVTNDTNTNTSNTNTTTSNVANN